MHFGHTMSDSDAYMSFGFIFFAYGEIQRMCNLCPQYAHANYHDWRLFSEGCSP